MKKLMILAAAAVLAMGGFAASAQCPNNKDGKPCQQQCTQQQCGQEQCNGECRHAAAVPARQHRLHNDPFAGIELTAEQKTALEAIAPAANPRQMRGRRAAAGSDSTSVAVAPTMSRRDYMAAVKQVLTPEQYVTFLENMVVEQDNAPRRTLKLNAPARKSGDNNGSRRAQRPNGNSRRSQTSK